MKKPGVVDKHMSYMEVEAVNILFYDTKKYDVDSFDAIKDQ